MFSPIKKIQQDLLDGVYSNNPVGCADAKAVLAGEYAFLAGQLEDILSRRAAKWNAMRKDFKSDTACSRAYEETADGVNEQGLRLRMKSIEKMLSALSALLKVAEGVALNQY